MESVIHKMVGCNPTTPEGKEYLKARSPIHFANKIKKPLLIAHGANDVRVKQSESETMVKAMQANGIGVTYALFPDEGHRFMLPDNRGAFYALAEEFLARYLGGRFEEKDLHLQTSMQVVVDDFHLN
jgi:dipeptidyl aminopeptidase/acylaminoacyl peptidase